MNKIWIHKSLKFVSGIITFSALLYFVFPAQFSSYHISWAAPNDPPHYLFLPIVMQSENQSLRPKRTPSATPTTKPPSPTPTSIIVSPTRTNTPVSPTSTNTSFSPTPTRTHIPTNTPQSTLTNPPTPLPTLTPTPTNTPTSIPGTNRIYYVSPNGADTNNGLTLSTAFKTIQKGIDKINNPGDTLLVLPGEYKQIDNNLSGQVAQIVNKHGLPGQEIVVKAYDPNNKPVLAGFQGIKITASSYILVEGFEVTDTYGSAIGLFLSDHVIVKNNYIHLDFEGNCSLAESQDINSPFFGCTYYQSKGIGEIKGRHDKNGARILEFDNKQNVGVYLCKSSNNQIIENHIENADESIYSGQAGNVAAFNCWYSADATGKIWTEQNVFADNLIENSWNEAIELKPDTRNNIVRNNIIRNTRPMIETALIEVRGHNNEITGNVMVGAPNVAVRIHSETPSDPGPDRVEAYKKSDGSYKSSYENYIHHNYIYYWSEFIPTGFGILSYDTSAANRIEHNTLVGTDAFSGKVSEYASIKTISIPSSIVVNNMMVGERRVDFQAGNEKYESHVLSYASSLPLSSDYNGYFPKFKNNGSTCVVILGSFGIVCQNSNSYNQSVGYEFNSKFLDAIPLRSDENICLKNQLFTLPIDRLADRVRYCSSLLPTTLIQGAASDGTNIGAWQFP